MKTEIEVLISTGAIIHGVLLRHLYEGGLDEAISIVAKTDEDHKRVKECLGKKLEELKEACILLARQRELFGEVVQSKPGLDVESKPGSEIARDQRRPKRK